jgi:ornithine decarboxylase
MNPYCIVDTNRIQEAYSLWQEYLPEVKVFYAVKCNPNPKIIEYMSSLGISFDCASQKEIEIVLPFSSNILFANPCKLTNHIEYARKHKIQTLVVDCECELLKIKQYYPTCELFIRLAVNNTNSKCELSDKFGASLQEIPRLIELAQELDLTITGFSFHVGSGCTVPSLYYDALVMCKQATDIATSYTITIQTIDIGGGFQESNFKECAMEVRKGMQLFKTQHFISEVGRMLVESSHTLYMHVVCKKKKNDKYIYYVNDGLYGTFSCKLFDHATPLLKTYNTGPTYPSMIYGPTCDSLDKLEESIELPELNVGDVIYVENYGAYTTASASSFNGFSVSLFGYV